MKKIKNLVIALFLAFTFIVADLAAAPVTAQAAGLLNLKSANNDVEGKSNEGMIMNLVKSIKILNLKCNVSMLVSRKRSS